jgi:hypothetical protein
MAVLFGGYQTECSKTGEQVIFQWSALNYISVIRSLHDLTECKGSINLLKRNISSLSVIKYDAVTTDSCQETERERERERCGSPLRSVAGSGLVLGCHFRSEVTPFRAAVTSLIYRT